MSKFENEVFSTSDFINKLSIDTIGLKNIIKENQSNLTNSQLKKLEQECDRIKDNSFKPNKDLPLLSEFFVKHECAKMVDFENLKDFDQKTEKLKKLEKALKKEGKEELKAEINKLKISRDVEKQKFADLIQLRNDFNKSLKTYLKKQGLSFNL